MIRAGVDPAVHALGRASDYLRTIIAADDLISSSAAARADYAPKPGDISAAARQQREITDFHALPEGADCTATSS